MNHKLKSTLKNLCAIAPRPISCLTRNSGGVNKKLQNFAGRLLQDDLSDEQYYAITSSLIFQNGVRKTTAKNRNLSDLKEVFPNEYRSPSKPIRVLDMGCSIGLASLANYDYLSQFYDVKEYVLGDLYTELLYDQDAGLIFDQDGNLLQVLRNKDFVSVNFEYWFLVERLKTICAERTANKLRRSCIFNRDKCVKIELLHPRLKETQNGKVFKLERMNVLEPIAGEGFDIILCFFLLVKRYFNEEQLRQAYDNLVNSLNKDGVLVVGESGNIKILRKH